MLAVIDFHPIWATLWQVCVLCDYRTRTPECCSCFIMHGGREYAWVWQGLELRFMGRGGGVKVLNRLLLTNVGQCWPYYIVRWNYKPGSFCQSVGTPLLKCLTFLFKSTVPKKWVLNMNIMGKSWRKEHEFALNYWQPKKKGRISWFLVSQPSFVGLELLIIMLNLN